MADCDPPLQALTSIEAAISHNAAATNVDTCEAITVTESFNTPLTDPVVLTIFDEGTETATSVTVMTAAAEAEVERSLSLILWSRHQCRPYQKRTSYLSLVKAIRM